MNVQRAVKPEPSASGRSRIEQQLIAAVDRSKVRKEPFDHIAMDEVLDPVTYAALLAALPDPKFFHDLQHRDAVRQDGTSTRLRMYLYSELLGRLPSPQRDQWRRVARALCSSGLEAAFKRKFRGALEKRFGKAVENIGLFPIPILLRDQPGYRIGIHSDVPKKAITVQFYLPRDDSQRDLGTIFHESNAGEGAERTTKMNFLPATGYAFPVALTKSWHSAVTASDRDGERVSMMLTYYVADSLPRRLYWIARRVLLSLGIHSDR